MSYQFLQQLPKHLDKAYELGDIVVNSGVARYANGAKVGKIAAHLEPASPMLSAGVGMVSPPAAIALEVAKAGKGLMDTAKLNKIIQLTQSLQTLSAVNLAVSGVSLGVSVVGFAMVLHKLNQLDNRLKSVEAKVDTLKRNEVLKLVRTVKLGIKRSITLVHQLDEQGWSEYLDTELAKQLDNVEVLLEEVLSRYVNRDDINVSSELAQYLHSAYANLLKVYLTARYKNKKSLEYPAQRIQTLEIFSALMISPDLLDELYEAYLINQEHRFLESELDYIFELYKYGCQNTHQVVNTHHEILITVPLKKFRRWEKVIRKSQEPAIWVEHDV